MPDYPDFSRISLLKGFYGGAPTPIAVDANGYLIALLSGLFGGTPKGLVCDANGYIQINLTAQDLAELTNRATFGAPDYTNVSTSVTALEYKTLINLSGKGQIYNAILYIGDSDYQATDELILRMDGQAVFHESIQSLYDHGVFGNSTFVASMLQYDTNSPKITISLTAGWTFESEYYLQYYHSGGGPVSVRGMFYYGLI